MGKQKDLQNDLPVVKKKLSFLKIFFLLYIVKNMLFYFISMSST